METENIINFRNSISDMSIEDLEKLLKDLNNQINKMVLDSDLIIKVAIVDTVLKDKKGA